MKNMFFIINKEKVYAYIVSIFTIIVLFFMSTIINSDLSETKETSSNIQQNGNINNALNHTNESNYFDTSAALVSNDNMNMENNSNK